MWKTYFGHVKTHYQNKIKEKNRLSWENGIGCDLI